MTLLEFIKSQLTKDTPVGDLTRDIQGDKEFPVNKSEDEIISYLDYKTRLGGTNSIFKRFLKAYKVQKGKEPDSLDLNTRFSVLKAESWKFYKEHFSVDKVILVGHPYDIYKAYCVDSTSGKALYFNIKSSNSINDILLIDEERIQIGNFTEQVSADRAIHLLKNCTYDTPVKPDKERFDELLDFLKANN